MNETELTDHIVRHETRPAVEAAVSYGSDVVKLIELALEEDGDEVLDSVRGYARQACRFAEISRERKP